MIPKKLERGDTIAVISPSRSLSIIGQETIEIALRRFRAMGIEVAFAKHAKEIDDFNSSSIESRVEDLHWAFTSKDIDAILTTIGGFNSNQLLRYLDYGLIKDNPKILCGYSDITALQNAIYAKIEMVTYSGPHFSTFGMEKEFDYTLEYFQKALFKTESFEVKPSSRWSDDEWWDDQKNRESMPNPGFNIIHEGKAEGTIIGANLCTFNLLQGTEFMPSLKNSVLFLEDDKETNPVHFDRDLQSLIHQPGFEGVKGIAIGRFQKASNMSDKLLEEIINTKRELSDMPVISGVDFGHTTPQITFPIGGTAKIEVEKGVAKIKIIRH